MKKYIVISITITLILTSCSSVSQTSCPAWGSCSNEDINKISVELNKIN